MSGEAKRLNGLPEAVGAYTIWGFMPLFFKQLQGISPVEICLLYTSPSPRDS